METIAEGVEDAGVAEMLLGLGCTMAQGWLYGKAMAPEALARRLWAPGGTLARTAPWRPEGAQL